MPETVARREAVPMQWHVNNLSVAGLSWGESGERPLLALHGWLDNAASFACLAPLLTGFHVVALDLTGHGQSARRSADASYQIWDDLPEVMAVLDALGWNTFDLVGHSRGAIISTLLAASHPEKVRQLVLLDAVSPDAVPEEKFATQLRRAIDDKRQLLDRANRVFPSADDAVASRTERGLPDAAARLLAERNLRACPGGVTWTTDPRLRGASAVKLTAGQIQAVLKALSMPTLLLLAGSSRYPASQLAEQAQRYIENLEVDTIEGGHHFHMEPGVSEVARRIEEFLASAEQRNFA